MILVDTNILFDLATDDSEWFAWSRDAMQAAANDGSISINPIIYAELSLAFTHFEALDAALDGMGLAVLDLPRPALFLAGKAFAQYRRRGGTKSNVLSDFFIGAHAAVAGVPILTRDTARYRTYFPSVLLIAPQS